MATSGDLFLAILALDSYNRGYGPGMALSADPLRIGDATIRKMADDQPSQDASFFAVAYNWEGETVISYRGTRFPGAPDWGDVKNGWTLSLGYAQASQAAMALQFYTQVQAQYAGGQDIVLTGHSLGGGLAGFVSDLTGSLADVFNNIAFGTSVVAQILSSDTSLGMSRPAYVFTGYDPTTGNYYRQVPGSSATVSQFITTGEVATGLRFLSGPLSFALFVKQQGLDPVSAAALAAYGVYLDNTTGRYSQTLSSNVGYGGASPTDLHSQSLMVLLLYANVSQLTDWASVGTSLYNALFDDNIANAVGFVKEDIGWYSPSARMMAAIAYSALYNPGASDWSLVFGDTAIRALFDDENQLGRLV